MVSAMDRQWSPSSGRRNSREPEFNLTECGLKAHSLSRETTKNSRRFSASYVRSFKEETKSFRSSNTTTISSTASSPGYFIFKDDQIDPSTYSFNTALRVLQAKSGYGYGWEWLSPDGFVLNSKWNEAEKYICNPRSGEVPMECLSAKSLSRRRSLSSKAIMSSTNAQHKSTVIRKENQTKFQSPTQVEKVLILSTRDMGTQSTPPPDPSSSRSESPSTPPIEEISRKPCKIEGGEASSSNTKSKSDDEERRDKKEEMRIKQGNKFMYKISQFWYYLPWRCVREQKDGKPSGCGRFCLRV